MSTVECRCTTVGELYGAEAEEYNSAHLRSRETGRMEQRFGCPDTGREWVLDYPDRTEREPGQARLLAEPL